MHRGTTPTLILTVDGEVDLTEAKNLYVTISQYGNELTRSSSDGCLEIDSGSVSVYLTQKETLSFSAGWAKVQIRGIYEDGTAFATDIASVQVDPVLLEGVIE